MEAVRTGSNTSTSQPSTDGPPQFLHPDLQLILPVRRDVLGRRGRRSFSVVLEEQGVNYLLAGVERLCQKGRPRSQPIKNWLVRAPSGILVQSLEDLLLCPGFSPLYGHAERHSRGMVSLLYAISVRFPLHRAAQWPRRFISLRRSAIFWDQYVAPII